MPLKVGVKKNEDGSFIVSPVGSIDSDTFAILEKELMDVVRQSTRGVILDMAKVDYVSSTGFGVIIRAKQALENKNIALAISNLQPNVKDVFDAVKAIPESLFATLCEADEYLDRYIKYIHDKEKK
jgi:anti-anti-sigma factor